MPGISVIVPFNFLTKISLPYIKVGHLENRKLSRAGRYQLGGAKESSGYDGMLTDPAYAVHWNPQDDTIRIIRVFILHVNFEKFFSYSHLVKRGSELHQCYVTLQQSGIDLIALSDFPLDMDVA